MSPASLPESTAPSLLVIETGVTAAALAIALGWPRVASPLFQRAERVFARLAARPRLSVLAVGVLALLLRLSILPLVPAPQPFIHDEFSFLLAGDTFASGRVTNPTHQMWQHFESFHITQKPTYMSMYFPVQGLFLAAGEKLAGHPWYGVCASAALMCAAICWMLQGWLPPGWALFGALLAVLRLALFSYWINSYYGGAAAAIGGSLVLGPLPRVMRHARVSDSILMALGVAILANSRPWEGMLVCISAALALVWRVLARPHPPAAILIRRVAAPAALLSAAAFLTGYYNYRVFGSPLTLPYQVNRATYASAPVFIWQSPHPEPVYHHAVMREFYTKWELRDFLRARTLSGFVSNIEQKIGVVLFFCFGPALFAPLFLLPRVFRDRRIRFLMGTGGVVAVGLSVNAWLFAHYIAPFVGGVYAVLIQSMRHLRVWRPADQPAGLAIVRMIPVVCVLLAAVRLFAAPAGILIPRWPTMWYGTEPLGLPRARVAAELAGRAGEQLAIVRYRADHSVFDDWVYNSADIDHAKVVWAREMEGAANSELLRYFRNRRAWLVEPDANPPRISPYPTERSYPAANQATCKSGPSSIGSRINR